MDRRKELDRQRYLAHREERKAKQREYYQRNKEACKNAVKRSKEKRDKRLRMMLLGW